MFLVKFKVGKYVFNCKGMEVPIRLSKKWVEVRKAVNFVPPKEKSLTFKILSGVAV